MLHLRLSSGEPVEDRRDSHLPSEVKRHIAEILSRVSADQVAQNEDGVEIDMGRVMGGKNCLETTDADTIVYARRPGRSGLTRFIKNRGTVPCSTVTIILRRLSRGNGFFIVSGWVGFRAQPEPWDRHAKSGSLAFWNAHALVWGSRPTVPGTETTACPWPADSQAKKVGQRSGLQS